MSIFPDSVDKKILSLLEQNARISNAELAEKVNLSPTPCLRRLRKLESSGLIRGYAAVLDEKTVTGPELLKTIEGILDNPESLTRMKQAAGKFTDKRAEDIILPYIEKERDLCTGR